jgi:hypothetical protein
MSVRSITNRLAWDYATNWNQISNFTMFVGQQPAVYTSNYLTGKVLSNRFVQPMHTSRYLAVAAMGTDGMISETSNEIMVPATNVIVTVTTTGTNLACSTSLRGSWTNLNATTFIYTNPTATLFFRGLGKNSAVSILRRNQ